MKLIQPVILSGGSGTRLWPLSREQYPKQLLPLIGDDSLLQTTVLRLDAFKGPYTMGQPMVVSNEDYRFITAEQMRQISRPLHRLVLEPAGRNTAPALTVAARLAMTDESDPILLVMPADHLIQDAAEFCRAIETGAALAAEGRLVTFGVLPTHAETGYGYLQLGTQLADTVARPLTRFVEKPAMEAATAYVAEGGYLWNAGIFMMRASVWLNAVARYAPDVLKACDAACLDATLDGEFLRLEPKAFLAAPSISIDYAVMEPLSTDVTAADHTLVVPLAAGWSDVGAWDALWAATTKDEAGNATSGDVLLEDVKDSLVRAQSRLVTCIGLRDMIVIETADAVFVAAKGHAAEVRRVVSRLKAAKRSEVTSHRKIHRPWGYYDAVDGGDRFQVKRIVVSPKASLSLQMHHHRAEHWVVVRGTARVTRGEENFLVSENQSTYIPLGVQHRLENPGHMPLEMIEVQSGAYLGEDDIVRFSDSYGRA